MKGFALLEVSNYKSEPNKRLIEGKVKKGKIEKEMNALVYLDGGAYWSVPAVCKKEFTHNTLEDGRISVELLVEDDEGWESLMELCPIGEKLKLLESTDEKQK